MIEKADSYNINLLGIANTWSTYVSILLYYELFVKTNSRSISIKMEKCIKKKESSYIAPLTSCAYGKFHFLKMTIEKESNPNINLSMQK